VGRPRDPAGVAPPPTATTGALVDVDRTTPRTLYALSDVHGGYDRLAALLAGAGVTPGVPERPDAMRWAAGDAVLVVTGDLIDKGPQPIEVIDALRALETSAAAAGGRVVVLLGNHEAEFFVNPTNKKANGSDGVDRELDALHVDPYFLAAGDESRGQWLLARPFGARVGGWFFSHGGSTHGRTFAELDSVLRAELVAHPTFDSAEIVGDGSILEERGWYGDPAVAPANARALGVSHIVFGHDPNALGARGAIAVAQNGVLFRIDCGMSPGVDDSTGCILRVHREGSVDVAEELRASGPPREIFRE
jgi:3',5'-cyclic AMP phosphodiesterase CpdA